MRAAALIVASLISAVPIMARAQNLAPTPPAAQVLAPGAWRTIETRDFDLWSYTASRGPDGAACAVHTHWRDIGRQLRLVVFEAPRTMHLAIADPRWTIPPGSRAEGTVAIDGMNLTRPFTTGTPVIAAMLGASLGQIAATELAEGAEAVGRITRAFAAGREIRVSLPAGDPLVAALRGSGAATEAMQRCMQRQFGTGGR